VASKSVISSGVKIFACFVSFGPISVFAQASVPPRFVGIESCSTSGCHGGAGEMRHQFDTWRRLDFHSRAAHTLTSARSEQIAKAAGIPDPAKSTRCTSCHAPFHEVPFTAFAAEPINASIGVSCESCHGAAEKWLLTHTRNDLLHAEKVAAGMRDLRDLYVRANTCVACHQTVEIPLLGAGHPELIFELDGQSVTQPRHWIERGNYHGGLGWLVGQAVALRELSWQLSSEPRNLQLAERRAALVWLLKSMDGLDASLPSLKLLSPDTTPEQIGRTQHLANELARGVAALKWSADHSLRMLIRLAALHKDFREKNVPAILHSRRADRLVLALDRLSGSLDLKKLEGDLDTLFKLTQSAPDFAPEKFAVALEKLSAAVENRKP
jgi:hypothetical protein